MKSKLTSSSVKYKSSLLTMPTTCTQDSYLKLAEVIFALNVDTKLSVPLHSKVNLSSEDFTLNKPNDEMEVTECNLGSNLQPEPCGVVLFRSMLSWGLPDHSDSSKTSLTKKSLPDSLFQIWHKSLLLFSYMPFQFAKIYPKYRYMETIFRKMSLMQKSFTNFGISNPS